jgi:DNA-binding CsgD family transcriptional regulator
MERFGLTPAERRITWGAIEGKTSKEIAYESGRALSTIRDQYRDLYRKTSARNRTHLAAMMLGYGPAFDERSPTHAPAP